MNFTDSVPRTEKQQVLRETIHVISGSSKKYRGKKEQRSLWQRDKKDWERKRCRESGKPLAVCWAASEGHATTLTTLSTQNLHHMLEWLCNPILAKTPVYYLLKENDGDYHKVFPSRMSVQSPAVSSADCWEHLDEGESERPERPLDVWPLAFMLTLHLLYVTWHVIHMCHLYGKTEPLKQ